MKVPLPSNGILGVSQVDLREPSFRDIRALNQENQEEDLLKAAFVKALLPANINLSKLTKFDLDYLFIIAAFSTQLNKLQFKYKCACGEMVQDYLELETFDVDELKPYKLPFSHSLNGVTYNYTILSAQQHIDACEYALNQEEFEEAYTDHIVASILNIDLSQVNTLPVQVYTSALLFQKANYHGVKLVKPIVCPHCSRLSNVHVNVGSSVVRMDLTTLLEAYDGIKNNVDFQAFLDFTSAEYKAYCNILETKEKDQR